MLTQDCQGCDYEVKPVRVTDNSACMLTGQDIGEIDKCPEAGMTEIIADKLGASVVGRSADAPVDPLQALVKKAELEFFPWVNTELIIETPEQLKDANDMLGIGKSLSRDLEAARKAKKAPLQALADAVDDEFNPVKNRVQIGVKIFDQAVITYQLKVAAWNAAVLKEQEENRKKAEAAALEEMKANAAKIEEAKETGEILPDEVYQPVQPKYEDTAAPIQSASKVKGNMSTSSVKTTYEYLVVDPDLVPRDLCSPDMIKIKARHKSGIKNIPGVLISEKRFTTTRLG